MDFFKRLSFWTFSKKDVIDERFLDAQTSQVLNEFDGEYRFKEVNELEFVDREIRTNLLYAITLLWTKVVNASHTLYKKIQILEADYIDVRSQLDNKIEYELQNLEDKRHEIQREIKEVDKEIAEYDQQRKEIEREYHKLGEEKTVKGSLNRLNGIWFLIIMSIAGAAELFMYKNVFLSQEIGLMADKPEQEKYMVELMALGMASGFTVMIIWLAHKLGELLRHYESAIKSEKIGYWVKMSIISLAVFGAIYATVTIRADMHTILAKDEKVTKIKAAIEQDNEQALFSDDASEDEDEDKGFGDDESEESNAALNKYDSKQQQIEELTNEVNQDKGKTAWLFSIINIFIVIGGVFLSYETHTSSPIYETIEKHLAKLEKIKKSLERELKNIDEQIVHFKNREINPLFQKLLLKAALYDKEVRTYNTYMQIFQLKMQMIEDYIKKSYEEKGWDYSAVSYVELLDEKIKLDIRKELHHVSNIEEYMIYKYDEIQKKKGESNV